MGTPDFSVGTLEALVEAGYEITGVVTQPDKPKGRGKQMMPTPVKEAAEKHGLPVYQPRRVRDAEAIEEIRKMEPDVIVVVAFGQIIPKEILDMPKYGCINVHASLLPAYRGAAPIQWAVMNGDEVSGVTIMLFMPSALLPTVSIQAEKVSSVHTEVLQCLKLLKKVYLIILLQADGHLLDLSESILTLSRARKKRCSSSRWAAENVSSV